MANNNRKEERIEGRSLNDPDVLKRFKELGDKGWKMMSYGRENGLAVVIMYDPNKHNMDTSDETEE